MLSEVFQKSSRQTLLYKGLFTIKSSVSAYIYRVPSTCTVGTEISVRQFVSIIF
jgi:hypothetical protein